MSERNHRERERVRDYFTMIGLPKMFVLKRGGSLVKLSLWPFCGWNLRPTMAIGTVFSSKECNRCNILPVRLGCLTVIQNRSS